MGGIRFSGKMRYEGVRFNVIIVTRRWVGVQFPEKKHYITLEWPHTALHRTYLYLFTFQCSSLEDELRKDRNASSGQKPTLSTQGEAGMKKEEERNPDESVDEDDWESEAHKLYEWTQELSLDELVETPRLSALSLTASR